MSPPLVSFCLATYKRQSYLKKTLQSILAQKGATIEIIVSDNDATESGKRVVNALHSSKITYFANQENLGMVASFNKTLSRARGKFVVFIADDDPLENIMLETLIPLTKKYPQCASYFGASNIFVEDEKVAQRYRLRLGKNSRRDKTKPLNEVNIYSPQNFAERFLNHKILPYMLWSTGIVRRSLVKKIKGMPDYGSPFLTDYAYILKVGMKAPMCVINRELGSQTIHADNFGRSDRDVNTLVDGISTFYTHMQSIMKLKRKLFQNFLSEWVVNHLLSVYAMTKKKQMVKQIFQQTALNLPFLEQKQGEFGLRLSYPLLSYLYFNGMVYVRYILEGKFFKLLKNHVAN